MCFDEVEAAGWMDRGQSETALVEQFAVLPLGAFEPAGPAEHIQITQRVRLVLLRCRRRLRHQPFGQQQLAVAWQRLATVLEYRDAARIIPVMDHALEDDRIRDCRNGFEEIARYKFDAIADTDLPKMGACGLGASWKVENSSAQFPVLLRDSAEQFAGPAAHVHQVGYPAEIVGAKDIRRYQPRELRHRSVELVDVVRRSPHQFETVGKALQFSGGLAGHDGFKQPAPAR